MGRMSETDLGELLIPWLEHKGWDVYQEVQFRYGGQRADLACLKDDELWIIELKVSLGLKVIEQAERWKVHYRSVGVKSSRRRSRFPQRVCKAFEVGLIEIDEVQVKEKLSPIPQDVTDRYVTDNYISELDELHKTLVQAGSKHGGYLTRYRRSMIAIREWLKDHPGSTLQEIYEGVGVLHYAHEKSFKQSVRMALRNYEDWCQEKFTRREPVIGAPKYTPRVYTYWIKDLIIEEEDDGETD